MDDVTYLLSARAVRERAHQMLALGLEDKLPHFRIELAKLDAVAELVLDVTNKAYPDGEVPFHSRWRHFVVGGVDRWAAIADKMRWPDAAARARAEFDLAITSVLLDAGAGAAWRYHDAVTGARIGRSEGLALASLDMFASGALSADPNGPLRADAARLQRLTVADLERGFQVGADNPLVGLEGRVALLRRLGDVVAARSEVFGAENRPRPGGLFDQLAAGAASGRIEAASILQQVLLQLGPIWPSRLTLQGTALGDCWRHAALVTGDATTGLVPLHKLSQWLSYSLIEPLQRAGLIVENIDGLTGLANRRRFDERLLEEWGRAYRDKTSLALLMIDIDHFKSFNDTYGHPAGDECLHTVAGILADEAQRSADMAARYGGEEFAILLPNTDAGGCARLGERIRRALHEARITHDHNPPGIVTASIGGAVCRPGFERSAGPASLVEAADRALYAAKDGGRDRVVLAGEVIDLPFSNAPATVPA